MNSAPLFGSSRRIREGSRATRRKDFPDARRFFSARRKF
jgi:hypothetical protein